MAIETSGLPNLRKWRIRKYAFVTAALTCFMAIVGLWPFSFCAPNNAVFLKTGGIAFAPPSIAYDIDTLTTSEKSLLADSVVTIRLRLRSPGATIFPRHRPAWILSLRSGHRERPLVGQWKSDLMVRTRRAEENVRPVGAREKKLWMRDAFLTQQDLDVVIVTGPPGTTLFVNGEQKAIASDCRMFDRKEHGPQRLQVGGSIIGKYAWNGILYELCVYKGDISGQLAKQKHASISPEAQNPVMQFSFENNGPLVRNRAGPRHGLYVSPSFPVSTDQVLVPVWDDFVNNREYLADIGVNFIGFIPFGFFFAGFLMLLHPVNRRNAFLGAVAGGFCLSLTIELLQVLLPLRSSQMSDLIFNTIGTVAGAGLWHWKKAP